jgi:UDPglucose 6-dehydrogenase
MQVSIIGTGYVGLVSGTCFSEMGHKVTCIDYDQSKIDLLKTGTSPIYEPGLSEMLTRNIEKNRIHFSTSYDSIKTSQVIFLAVGTPSDDEGRANLTYLMSAVDAILPHLNDQAVVVIKSTVPVGTNQLIRERIKNQTTKSIYVVNNPEFLKEGSAIDDFMKPDRVVIGHDSEFAASLMNELYAPLVLQGNPIYMMSNLSAEMTKYAANCFLATKISFINEMARLCDLTGADIEQVRKGITSDKRIGSHFLYPGPGYGGSCFPKDVKALIATAKDYDYNLKIVQAAEDVNKSQKSYMVEKIKHHYGSDLNGKIFAVWGVAFKPNTDDIRETPAIDLIKGLNQLGASVQFYDPIAADNFEKLAKSEKFNARRVDEPMQCLEGCDGLVLMTEWAEFRSPDYQEIKKFLKQPVVFDARNLFKTDKLKQAGLTYYAIGKKIN